MVLFDSIAGGVGDLEDNDFNQNDPLEHLECRGDYSLLMLGVRV